MPPKQKNEPINLSIRTNTIKYNPSILSCFHDNIDNSFSDIINYLKCGVKLYLEELKKILKDVPYNMSDDDIKKFVQDLSDEFKQSGIFLLDLFGKLIIDTVPDHTDITLVNFFRKLKLALELDIKHDHGGTRGHGVGKECVQFIADNGALQSGLGGITPFEIIKKNADATLLSSNGECLSVTHAYMSFPPLYKILDTPSKKCVKKYLSKTQTIKCLPTIIDSAGQADKVGEPLDFDILFEFSIKNFKSVVRLNFNKFI